MADPTPAKPATPAPPPAAPTAPRGPQTAVAPLNTITKEDIAAGAKVIDTWLRKISGDYVTLERLSMVASSLPIIGNIISLVDVIVGVVDVIQKYLDNATVEFFDWVGLGIDLIGVIPIPPSMAAARMSLRPALVMIRQKSLALKVAKAAGKAVAEAIGAAAMEILFSIVNDKIVGTLENFVRGAIKIVNPLVNDCAKTAEDVLGDLIHFLNMCIGQANLFEIKKAPPPETVLHDSQHTSWWNRMLVTISNAAEEAAKKSANYVARVAASGLPDRAKTIVNEVITHLNAVKGTIRPKLQELLTTEVELGILWLLKRLLEKVLKYKDLHPSANVPASTGTKSEKNRPGAPVEATKNQAPAHGDCIPCKNAAAAASKRSISFATGSETFTHTDFTLAASLPITWSRTYRSHLDAYDEGNFGARWITPYSMRIDIIGQGKKRSLRYHGQDGRSHDYAWLEVGYFLHDAVEELTITRLGEHIIVIDFGPKPPEGEPGEWRECYELSDDQWAPHFRLGSLHNKTGAGIGLRYDHRITEGPYAGRAILSDIVSKQGEKTLAHVGVYADVRTGLITSLWEIREGQLIRQLSGYEYDDQRDLISAQDENGASWHYSYDHHLVTRYTDRTGRGMNLVYDGTGPRAKAIREWADDGSFDTRFEWDPKIRLTFVIDAMGNETWHYYDILGYTYRIIYPDLSEEWLFRDEAKNVTRHLHPDGTSDHYIYYDGNLHTHIRRDGTQEHYEYNAQSNVVGILDADGGVWKREVNEQGLITEEIDPLGNKTEYAYDAAGSPLKVIDAKGGQKKLVYTATGKLASFTDCSGKTTYWQYDNQNRLVQLINAAGEATQFHYTPLNESTLMLACAPAQPANFPGQLEKIIRPDGTEERLRHDAEGRLLSHTDALLRTTAYQYSVAGQITQRTNALGHTLNYRWDVLGKLRELRNENDRSYRFEYDPVGRLLEEIGFDNKITRYRYDEWTGVLAEVEEAGVTTHVEFDPMGRLAKRSVDGQSETFSYTGNGRLADARNTHARLQQFYDAAGNLVREHHHYQGPHHSNKETAIWHHRYNELNQRIGSTRPDGHTQEWLTYGSGHVHGLLLDGEEIIGFERDALHREINRVQGNGLAQQQKYDPVGRLLEQQLGRIGQQSTTKPQGKDLFNATGGVSLTRRYRYDKSGQLNEKIDNYRGITRYQYDVVGRLTEAAGALGTEIFAFDPASNLVEDKRDPWNSSTPSPHTNRLLDNLLKSYAGTHYRYDTRGNLVERLHHGERSTFEWDGFNRMTCAVTPYGITHFTYDPLGRRIGKHHQEGRNITHTLFGWDGDVLAFESRETNNLEVDVNTIHYLHEPNSFVPLVQTSRYGAINLVPTTDVRALMDANEGKYDIRLDPIWNGQAEERRGDTVPFRKEEIAYYQCDHLGTPQEMTDSEGKLAWAAEYKAWGEAKEAISDAARRAGFKNRIRFQGQYYDEETGLHYNRYRYYDPFIGRFISSDPIKLHGGTNLHKYAPNPTQWIDPFGLVDINLFPTNEAIRASADNIPSPSGVFTVGGHGNPSVMVDASGKALSPKDMADMIKKDPNYKPGQTVQLMSCNTGKGANPYAKKVAKELNAPVKAPDQYLWIWPSGKNQPSGMKPDGTMDTSQPGAWHTFNP